MVVLIIVMEEDIVIQESVYVILKEDFMVNIVNSEIVLLLVKMEEFVLHIMCVIVQIQVMVELIVQVKLFQSILVFSNLFLTNSMLQFLQQLKLLQLLLKFLI